MKRNEDYTRGASRRDIRQNYIDDLCIWGGRVLALMTLASCALWIASEL